MKTSLRRDSDQPMPRGDNRRQSERIELVVRVDYKTVDELF